MWLVTRNASCADMFDGHRDCNITGLSCLVVTEALRLADVEIRSLASLFCDLSGGAIIFTPKVCCTDLRYERKFDPTVLGSAQSSI